MKRCFLNLVIINQILGKVSHQTKQKRHKDNLSFKQKRHRVFLNYLYNLKPLNIGGEKTISLFSLQVLYFLHNF